MLNVAHVGPHARVYYRPWLTLVWVLSGAKQGVHVGVLRSWLTLMWVILAMPMGVYGGSWGFCTPLLHKSCLTLAVVVMQAICFALMGSAKGRG